MNVCEMFYSIAGEGSSSGERTVFLRLSGCNIGCRWCDTRYASENSRKMSVEEVAKELGELLVKTDCMRLCITGGEPLIQQGSLVSLMKLLPDRGYDEISVETNCTIEPTRDLMKYITKWTVSPKLPSSGESYDKEVLDFFRIQDGVEWKFVISDATDYIRTDMLLSRLRGQVIYQVAADVPFDLMAYLAKMKWLTQKVLDDKLPVRVLPQLHKLMYGDRKGV